MRATTNRPDDCSGEIASRLGVGQTFVTVGNEYAIHAISIFEGTIHLQIVNDIGYPAWYPLALFEGTKGKLPSDWECRFFPGNGVRGLTMLLGPEFVVQDEGAYQRMVELDPEQVNHFWTRVDSLLKQDSD